MLIFRRFDCLFIMLDTIDVDSDRKIADHVVRMHRYRNPREQDGQVGNGGLKHLLLVDVRFW